MYFDHTQKEARKENVLYIMQFKLIWIMVAGCHKYLTMIQACVSNLAYGYRQKKRQSTQKMMP
jgi:hypothetical protein